jgi:hypothetical protein
MNKPNRHPFIDALLLQARPMALEQRFMFDAAAASESTDLQHALDDTTEVAAEDKTLASFAVAPAVSMPVEVRAVDPLLNGGRKEAAFVDTGVADYQRLVDGIRAGVEVLLLDSGQNGLTQIALWAQSHSGYDAIHVLSHGSDASIQLGQFQLNASNLNTSVALMGNTTVWKPASTSLLSNYYFMKILKEAGLPDGVINFIPGSGSLISSIVLKHKDLAGIQRIVSGMKK